MFDEETLPARQPGYMIGQKLDAMSVAEINQTIDRLRAEIERLERAREAKAGHMAAAEALFSKK